MCITLVLSAQHGDIVLGLRSSGEGGSQNVVIKGTPATCILVPSLLLCFNPATGSALGGSAVMAGGFCFLFLPCWLLVHLIHCIPPGLAQQL